MIYDIRIRFFFIGLFLVQITYGQEAYASHIVMDSMSFVVCCSSKIDIDDQESIDGRESLAVFVDNSDFDHDYDIDVLLDCQHIVDNEGDGVQVDNTALFSPHETIALPTSNECFWNENSTQSYSDYEECALLHDTGLFIQGIPIDWSFITVQD